MAFNYKHEKPNPPLQFKGQVNCTCKSCQAFSVYAATGNMLATMVQYEKTGAAGNLMAGLITQREYKKLVRETTTETLVRALAISMLESGISIDKVGTLLGQTLTEYEAKTMTAKNLSDTKGPMQ